MRELGAKTAELVGRAIRGDINPVQWMEKPPMIVNVTKHYTGIDMIIRGNSEDT